MKKIYRFCVLTFLIMLFSGCSPTNRVQQEIPEPVYTNVGHAIKSEIKEDGTVKLTYALVGLKEDKIEYLYLDQIEQNLQEEISLFSNKEMENAYGLSYESDHGEWHEQVNALKTYISGNKMTIDEVNAIPVEKIDENHLKVPEKGSELEAGCELDLTDFLDVINEACENAVEADVMRLAVGEDVRCSKINNQLTLTIGFVGTDYRYKINYLYLDKYVIDAEAGSDTRSLKQIGKEQEEVQKWVENLEAYENYILGSNLKEAIGVETYDPGNGTETALPKVGTDLAAVCNIDLDKFILVLDEAGNRFE